MPNIGQPCTFPECDRPNKNGGLCIGHYSQRMKGRPLTTLANSLGESERRFWEKVSKTGACWIWRGHVLNSGYGMGSIRGVRGLVHRIVYSMNYGPINDGHVVDHICRNKLCVNPAHLRAVTHTENVRTQGLRTNNTSGVRGVNWDAARNKWAARVNVGGRKRYVGRFDTLEEAAQAVAAARAAFYA